MHKNLTLYSGNLLIIVSLLALLFIYYPFLKVVLFKQQMLVHGAEDQFSITIPRINAMALVISDVDPWDKNQYSKALERGVAQAKGSANPGEVGRMFLFAHSSELPWRMTRQNTPFLLLPRLAVGDEVIITKGRERYLYKVTQKETVLPSDTSVLKEVTKKRELVLQTCIPVGTDLRRLLIYAELVEDST